MKHLIKTRISKAVIIILLLSAFQPVVAFNFVPGELPATDPELEIIRDRVISNLMQPDVNEAQVAEILQTIRSDGSWPGISYEDVSRTGFDQPLHLSNMITMARAYKKPGNRYNGDHRVKTAIHSALDFWLEHDFICDNWWHNQIGTPRNMIDFMLIMDTDLTDIQRTGGLQIAERANMQASGARQSGDRILIAGLLGKQGIFKRDVAVLEEVIDIMSSDIKIITEGPGIKSDLSYHHRQDNVVSTLTYGLNPPRFISTWALKIKDTRFSFPKPVMELLVDYYLDGVCKSMVYGRYSDPGVQNREISRDGVLDPASPAIAEALYMTSHYRRDELKAIAEIRTGEKEPDLRYSSFFWNSEYFTHQRPDWFASVRMYSERNNNIDAPHNEEGLKNHHFADGANFLSVTAKEYDGIFPVWNWQRVPGTTVVQKPALPHWNQIVKKGPSSFVGGVTDGEYGAAVFDFDSPHDPLQVRKSWFFFDDEYVSLGSGIKSTSDFPVNTTISQRFLENDVYAGHNDKMVNLAREEHLLDNVSWVYHDNVAYFFPSPGEVNIKNRTATGNWRSINHTHWATEDPVSADLFTLWLDHGIKPQNDSYEYIVVPNIELPNVESYRQKAPVKILSNTTSLQAVRHENLDITQVVFYEPGEIVLGDGTTLSVDKPCIVMVKGSGRRINRITVSDPARKHDKLELTVSSRVRGSGENWSSTWNRKEKTTRLTIDLPVEGLAGKSVVLQVRPGYSPEKITTGERRPHPEPSPEPGELNLYKVYATQPDWLEMTSVEDVYSAYPERMQYMLQHLDLEQKGLEKVKQAYEAGDFPLACEYLLDHYSESVKKDFTTMNVPGGSTRTTPAADSIILGIHTYYRTPDIVPVKNNGHIDWFHHGPENDIEWAWALNRHFAVGTLLSAWIETGNPKYARFIDRFIKDWIISSWPYPAVRSSTAMWRGLEVSFRVKFWAQAFHSLKNTGYLSPATQLLILGSLPDHAHYARNFHAQGNWLTMEISGLSTVAASWPEFKESKEWIDYSINVMIESMKGQVYPDGVQTELTSSYHQVSLSNFSQFNDICNIANVSLPDFYTSTIEDMWSYLAATMRPDGHGLLNNNADLRYNRESIMKAASAFDRADWEFIASNGTSGREPETGPSFLFPWAGHLISRSDYGPDAHWSFFDIGPWGSGHQHNDKLHLSVAAYGRDLLVDAGRFAYRGEIAERFRPYALSSQSHNLLLIDGKGQGPGPRLTVDPLPEYKYMITENFDYASASFENFIDLEGDARHTRSLLYVRGEFWVVVDHLESDRPREIEALWHWHPSCQVHKKENGIVASHNNRGNLQIIPVGSTNWNIEFVKGHEKSEVQGWYSREYNIYEPNTAAIYSTNGVSGTSFAWVLFPYENNAPEVKAEILSQETGAVKIRVSVPGKGYWDVSVPSLNSAKAGMEYFPDI